jgi:hypothetical protein
VVLLREGVDVVQELTKVVVASARTVGVEAFHCCIATGIRPGLRLLWFTINFSSHACYKHCATGAHYLEYKKMTSIRNVGDCFDLDDEVSKDQPPRLFATAAAPLPALFSRPELGPSVNLTRRLSFVLCHPRRGTERGMDRQPCCEKVDSRRGHGPWRRTRSWSISSSPKAITAGGLFPSLLVHHHDREIDFCLLDFLF